jgi:hypothetical protein
MSEPGKESKGKTSGGKTTNFSNPKPIHPSKAIHGRDASSAPKSPPVVKAKDGVPPAKK